MNRTKVVLGKIYVRRGMWIVGATGKDPGGATGRTGIISNPNRDLGENSIPTPLALT